MNSDGSGFRRRVVLVLMVTAVAGPVTMGDALTSSAATAAGTAEPRSAVTQGLRLAGPASLAGPVEAVRGRTGLRRMPSHADPSSAFVYRDGRFSALRPVPTAVLTAHSGINNAGQIMGIYADDKGALDLDAPGAIKGFVQLRTGGVTVLDLPFPFLHAVRGINELGQIVGYFDTDASRARSVGFLRRQNGKLITFSVPGTVSTSPWGINTGGQVTGNYTRADSTFGGFLRQPSGAISLINVPGASETTPNDINDGGQVVGAYLDGDAASNPDGTFPRNAVHGFVLNNGRFTGFDVPGSVFTQAFGINSHGDISGGYYDAAGRMHGFLLSNGNYRTLDVPGRSGTLGIDVNDNGEVVVPDPNTSLPPLASP
jgi:uncharacterized membrane protein